MAEARRLFFQALTAELRENIARPPGSGVDKFARSRLRPARAVDPGAGAADDRVRDRRIGAAGYSCATSIGVALPEGSTFTA